MNRIPKDMNKILLSVTLTALLLASCAGRPGKRILTSSEMPNTAEGRSSYKITDYKDKINGGNIPEWVNIYLDSGVRELETDNVYQDRYVFVSRNEGNNFNALSQWSRRFSPDLDFPRMAGARIEARLSSGITFPDEEFGSFYGTLVCAAFDAPWTGAVREDDFWIKREFFSASDEQNPETSGFNETNTEYEDMESSGLPRDKEIWEFLILVTIEKSLFASQLDTVFKNVIPKPQPTRDQMNAANRVKDHFLDGF